MRNPYLAKLVALAERLGDSERFKRVERETEKLIADAKVKVDLILAESATKSEQLVRAAHVAKEAYQKGSLPWQPAKGDHLSLDEEGAFEALHLTDVTVSIEKSGKRGSKIVISTKDGASMEIRHSGSASIVESANNLPIKAKKRRGRS